MFSARSSRILAALLLFLLPVALFYRSLLLGQAFVPADLLGYVAPWSHFQLAAPPAAWNVLRFDGIAEFYPWRLEAARQLRGGSIPLWNPYTFAAHGGAPLLADSQSAPLYPPNLLFSLTPPGKFWYAFGLSAALHLFIAAKGLFRLLRAYRLRRSAALLGAMTWALSGPVVCWLSLPTFLAVMCWLPWLLLLIRRSHVKSGTLDGRLATVGAGGVAGLMLLAGHLQMAFYGLLAASLYAIWLGAGERQKIQPTRWILGFMSAVAIAGLLALPQVLPTLELSRVSHRAGPPPGMEAYRIYIENAFPVRNLATLLIPDLFGHPNPVGAPYWNTNNYAEWAAYIGVVPLLLAVFGMALPWRGEFAKGQPQRGFWVLLAAIALLLAMGTPVNLPLFFLVPGYSQTGNPGRSLILFTFALAILAAIGLDSLLDPSMPTAVKRRATFIAAAVPTLAVAVGVAAAGRFAAEALPQALPGTSFGQLMAIAMPGVYEAAALVLAAAVALYASPGLSESIRRCGGTLLIVLSFGELFLRAIAYNPASPTESVYPVTPGIAFLQHEGEHALIAPLNRDWSIGLFDKRPPYAAILPPNSLMVYGLHDVGGYDSLFPGAAKAQIRDAGNGADPSPLTNGNMVFIKRVDIAVNLGARFLVFAPETAPPAAPMPPMREVYRGVDMVIWENPSGRDYNSAAEKAYQPDSFRIGLFCGMISVAALTAAATGSFTLKKIDGQAAMRQRQALES